MTFPVAATVPGWTADAIASLLGTYRFFATSEAELQEAIEATFVMRRVPYEREVSLGVRSRVDFLVEGAVALEVKVDGSLSDVARQMARYASFDRVREMVLATRLHRHGALAGTAFEGKPIHVVRLRSFL